MRTLSSLSFLLWLGLSGVALSQPAPQPSGAAPGPAGAAGEKPIQQDSKKKYDPQLQCVDADEFAVELRSGRNPVGEAIVIDGYFLPTEQPVSVGLRTSYVDKLRYFAALERSDGVTHILQRQDVITRRAVASDTLVQRKLLEPDQVIVTLTMDDDDAGLWQRSDLYLYTCGTEGSPAKVSKSNVRLSPHWYSLWACAVSVLLVYVWVALALRRPRGEWSEISKALNPVKLTAGRDGKGSLSKFQILTFTLTVFGLIALLLLQTGVLSDLSATILALLGISGIGATLAKGADAQRNAISPENRAWLLRKGWVLATQTTVDPSNASWRDFFTTEGEFDVYRYQSFIFGFVVIFSMIAAGVTQLSTFVIPSTILGIVGLSQAIYIGGKLVTPTNISDLNAAIADLRDRERKLRDAATAKKQGKVVDVNDAAQQLGQPAIDAYLDKARDVAALFTDATGTVVAASNLQPAFD
jgi:hypothetical protein